MLRWLVVLMIVTFARGQQTDSEAALESYLVRYGYLQAKHSKTNESNRGDEGEWWLGQIGSGGGGDVGELRSADRVETALVELQRFAGLAVTGALDDATRRLLTRKRCGVPDRLDAIMQRRVRPRRRTKTEPLYVLSAWPRNNLTWNLLRDSPKVPGGSRITADTGRIRRDLHAAFQVWTKDSQLSIREVHANSTADIAVSFVAGEHGDTYPFDGQGPILAHAFFPGSGLGGDIHLDYDETWGLSDDSPARSDTVSLFAVAVHEIGHSIGLTHILDVNSLMFPWYRRLHPWNYSLPAVDLRTVQQLYGQPPPPSPPLPPPPPTRTISTTTTTTTTEKEEVDNVVQHCSRDSRVMPARSLAEIPRPLGPCVFTPRLAPVRCDRVHSPTVVRV